MQKHGNCSGINHGFTTGIGEVIGSNRTAADRLRAFTGRGGFGLVGGDPEGALAIEGDLSAGDLHTVEAAHRPGMRIP